MRSGRWWLTARRRVSRGSFQHAVHVSLDDVIGWGAMLAQALRETGGEMTPEERAWADEVLGRSASDSAA